MSRILNFIFSHYAGLFIAGVVFCSTAAQAQLAGTVNVASSESSESQPSAAPPAQTPATKPVAIMHLSKREAQLVRELHRHGVYW
jgi:hypothetical protein